MASHGRSNKDEAALASEDASTSSKDHKPTCGVVMPIAGTGDYTTEHWRRVQRIITRAIEAADMTPRLVWENPEVDVIHARILQGIYESDVLISDVSSLNPNVMLELGLRLSTKKPTIVITDGLNKPPFDIGVFQYHTYQRDLEYNSVDEFISILSSKIRAVFESHQSGKYKSFVESFTFEVVEPTEITVTADEAVRERLEALTSQLSRIERSISSSQSSKERNSNIGRLMASERLKSDLASELSSILALESSNEASLARLERTKATIISEELDGPRATESKAEYEMRRKKASLNGSVPKIDSIDREIAILRAEQSNLRRRAAELHEMIARQPPR